MRNHCSSYLGTFPLDTYMSWVKEFKKAGYKLRLRGRGRRTVDNHEDQKWRFRTDLPLKYAERVAIYKR